MDYSLSDIGAAFGTGSPAEEAQKPAGLTWLLSKLRPAESEAKPQVLYPTKNPLTAITDQDINRGIDMGMAFSGGGLGIKAYHGSPHDFERFDLSKIGTGEGAQAYGHGLYFAENEGVARSYRDALSTPLGGPEGIADRILRNSGNDYEAAAQKALAASQRYKPEDSLHVDYQKAASILNDWKTTGNRPGKMYEVNINADPAHFLDWDKPLSQQSEAVKSAIVAHSRKSDELKGPLRSYAQAIQEGRFGDVTGDSAYTLLNGYRDPAAATQTLREAGIPGIKYLDQGSRGAGEGSRNYVVFDDKLIDILKKYGLAGLLPAGAGLASQDQGQ